MDTKQRKIRLMAYNVRSLWNVGAFFRTADACNVEHIYLAGYTGFPPRKEISKTALGAEEFIPWERAPEPLSILDDLKKDGWHIVALEQTENSIDLHTYNAPDKVCLIAGNELTGVSEEMLERADSVVEIPMLGKKESLNVAVSTGIALYQLRHLSPEV